jgi:hypothetical protein
VECLFIQFVVSTIENALFVAFDTIVVAATLSIIGTLRQLKEFQVSRQSLTQVIVEERQVITCLSAIYGNNNKGLMGICVYVSVVVIQSDI